MRSGMTTPNEIRTAAEAKSLYNILSVMFMLIFPSWRWKKPIVRVAHWRQTTAQSMFRETALRPYFFRNVIRKPKPMKIITCTS